VSLTPIAEVAGLDAVAIRRDVLGGARPVVLRGLVADWPAVARARESDRSLATYLAGFDNGNPVDAVMTPPQEAGELFYNAALDGFNFLRNRVPLSQVIEQVLRYASFERPPAVAAQSAKIRDCVPGFAADNPLALLPASVEPRIWLGSAITTPTHIDEWRNLACVVAGRRRFTVFAPEQVANLYVGPLDFAPTGAPMSLVRLGKPDLERYPRFRQALAAAQVAELEAGDALYLPPLWWHHVASLGRFNVLVNYWWGATMTGGVHSSALDSLLHCILALRDLDPATRESWRSLFDHYAFRAGDEVCAHIPPARRGLLDPASAAATEQLRAHLVRALDNARR